MSLLGEQLIPVYRPVPGEHAYEGGTWTDERTEPELEPLVIDPINPGQLARTLGVEGAWTGGALHATSEAAPLYPVDDYTGRPADWLVYQGRAYEVVDLQSWPDDSLPCHVMTAVLMRPQPVLPEPADP